MIFFIAATIALIQPQWVKAQSDTRDDEAYEHNRQGMIAMSQAEFEEAIVEFQKAAALANDYQILGRSLIYTPVFMTAWANEKLGQIAGACREFRRFLDIAPPDRIEETKEEHARAYLVQHCKNL